MPPGTLAKEQKSCPWRKLSLKGGSLCSLGVCSAVERLTFIRNPRCAAVFAPQPNSKFTSHSNPQVAQNNNQPYTGGGASPSGRPEDRARLDLLVLLHQGKRTYKKCPQAPLAKEQKSRPWRKLSLKGGSLCSLGVCSAVERLTFIRNPRCAAVLVPQPTCKFNSHLNLQVA